MFKKISPGDWALILGALGGGCLTVIGFVVWLTHVDTRVTAISEAQASIQESVSKERDAREAHDEKISDQLGDIQERLGKIEGIQKVTLKEVRHAR